MGIPTHQKWEANRELIGSDRQTPLNSTGSAVCVTKTQGVLWARAKSQTDIDKEFNVGDATGE